MTSQTSRSWGRRAGGLALGALAAVGLVRAAAYAVYAASQAPTPLEAFHLEAKMVHLAWRVQHGARLYPPWRVGPTHVANFFGPVYFLLVGLIGRALGADLDRLFLIGRAVTVASTLGLTALLGVYAARRYGPGAGGLAAVVSLGAAPMIGFGVMVRSDALADLLGFAGFLLSVGRTRGAVAAGCGLLVLAAFTRQTTLVYTAAAVLALALTGRPRAAAAVGGSVALGCAAAIAGVTFALEPGFAPGLLGESRSPWDARGFRHVCGRLWATAPDLPAFAALGMFLWGVGPTRDLRLLVLTAVLLTAGFVTAGKRGADLNYFLGLRSTEALAAASLWAAVRASEGGRALGLAGLAAAGAAVLVPGALFCADQARTSRQVAALLQTRAGQEFFRQQRALERRARDPALNLLTDSGRLDIERGERTLFADPWLFRLLVDTGQVDPSAVRRDIEGERFDWVVTTKPLDDPEYAGYEFGLPMTLAGPARLHYVGAGRLGSLFLHRPRGRATPSGGP